MLFVKYVNISIFMPVGKLQLSLRHFSNNSEIYAAFLHITYNKYHTN